MFGDYKVGDSGQGVTDLQGYLNNVGFSITVDGQYGPETQGAVRLFQTARGLSPDGVAGPQTLVELSSARAEGWQAPVSAVPVPTPRAKTDASATPTGAPAPTPPTKSGTSTTGLLILVAIAIGVWWFTGGSGKK